MGLFLEENSDQLNNPNGTNDVIWKRQVKQKVNEAYRIVVGAWNWLTLKSTVTLTDDSWIVPSDCRLITDVRDGNKIPYNFMPGANRNSKFDYNWYFDNAISTPLAEGATLAVGEYATALTSTAEFPATTCADEYVRIGANVGIYKISTWTSTSAMTLADHFRGDMQSAAIFQIRPRGTQVLAFCNSVGDALTPTDVELTYIRTPLPLYRDEDLIELPGSAQAVSIKALQFLLALCGFNRAADAKQKDYLAALSEMKSSEPQQNIVQATPMFRRNYGSKTSQSYLRGLSLINNG